MQKTVRIVNSPVSPAIEVVGDMVMSVGAPGSKDDVAMVFNPCLIGYNQAADIPGIKLRQLKVIQETADTVKAKFDFRAHNEQIISISGVPYTVRLLCIDSELYDGQKFPAFEFAVTWNPPEGPGV